MKSTVFSALLLGGTIVGVVGIFGAVIAQTAKSPGSQWDGVYTQAQSKRGEPLFTQYCATCHGPDLMGGEMAPPLTGGQFESNWNELPLSDLFERMRTSMPLNSPGTLSHQQIADILSYVLSKSNYPAGKDELPPQPDMLTSIKFLATKP